MADVVFVAGRLAHRLSAHKLRRWFAYLVLAVAAHLALQATFNLVR